MCPADGGRLSQPWLAMAMEGETRWLHSHGRVRWRAPKGVILRSLGARIPIWKRHPFRAPLLRRQRVGITGPGDFSSPHYEPGDIQS